jgi:hypothetical protein
MNENFEGTRVHAYAIDDDQSGIRETPWMAQLSLFERRVMSRRAPRAAVLADGMIANVGGRVLGRFERLTRDDIGGVLDAAADRLDPLHGPRAESRIAHAVLSAAIPVDLRRWADLVGAPPGEIARELSRAARRAAALSGRERSLFFAVSALDHVAIEHEVGDVVLRAAVAYQMRWNTAHQHLSRAWRKVCEGGPLGEWSRSFRAAHRFVCGPPAFELWEAARAYMDACDLRDDRGAGAFDAWVKAHEAHNAWHNEWRKQSARAVRRWKMLAMQLDASGTTPGAVHDLLVARCCDLSIDRWVVPAKLGQRSWVDLLRTAHRPPSSARDAWHAFIRDGGFGAGAEEALRALDGDADLAELAGLEVEHAYGRLLAAAEGQARANVASRAAFRALIDDAEPVSGDER